MKTTRCLIKLILCFFALMSLPLSVLGQSTAFTYQGRLMDGGAPANGSYDIRFQVYDAVTNGTSIAGPVTNLAVGVSNGLFTVTLDFGPGIFTGAERWLEAGIRTNGALGFNVLWPRQPVTSAPYAIQSANATTAVTALTAASAGSVSASNINGSLALTQLPALLVTNGAGNVLFNGVFSGSGNGITNVNVAGLDAPGLLTWPGNFTFSKTLGVGPQPEGVITTDVNGDGRLDLVSVNYSINMSSATLSVLTNNGNGGFVLSSSPQVGSYASSVTAADVNGDGRMDLISSSYGESALSVLTNSVMPSGDSRFASSTSAINAAVSGMIEPPPLTSCYPVH